MVWHWREHGCLVIVVTAYYKLCIAPSLLRDATHACWEVIQPAVVDFPHAWAACAQDDATGAGERHSHRQNARYAIVKSTGFLYLFFLWVLAHGPPRVIADPSPTSSNCVPTLSLSYPRKWPTLMPVLLKQLIESTSNYASKAH